MNLFRIVRRLLPAALVLSACSAAFAGGEIMEAFLEHYRDSAVYSELEERACANCHVSDYDLALNAYGKAMSAELGEQGSEVPNEATFATLEASEIEPGAALAEGEGRVATKRSGLIPKNAYHPAVVHFPIALFIGGLFLDFVGMIRRDKTLLLAGWFNIVMAAVTALAGLATGVAAMALKILPYRGLIFDHMQYAVLSTVIIWILVAMRMHRHDKMNLTLRTIYYVLATIALLTISWAGHLGGVFVYGH
jgi:uncharacterized membrane protein